MKSKKILGTMLLIAFLVTVIAALPIQTITAQTAGTQKTYAIVDAIPNRIGLGETTLLKCGITEALESAELGWTGLTIVVTKPDGTNTTLGPFKTDSTGSTFSQYTPDKVGTYTITTYFPQQTNPTTFFNVERGTMAWAGTIMIASSASCTLVVTEEPAEASYPGHSLPTEYWSRPIDPQLREWYSVSGNWVARPDNSVALYNDDAPETAHVLWAKDLTTGGMTGGLWGDGLVQASSESGDAYEGKFINSVIMNGILYYNVAPGGTYSSTLDVNGIKAVDLHTGEELWFKNDTLLSFGQILYWNSYNVDGVYTYLISDNGMGTWTAYDPFNAEWSWSYINVPSGAATVRGPSGEILIYQIDYENNWMALWNSTLCGLQTAARGSPDMGSWASNIHQKTLDASNPLCYSWNVTIPAGLQAGTSFFAPILEVFDDRVASIYFDQTQVRVWALNTKGLNEASTSTSLLFDQKWAAPSEWLAGSNTLHYVGATNYASDPTYGDGVIGLWSKELTTHYGFSLTTGKYLWATQSEIYLDAYGWGNAEHTWYYSYGDLYSIGVGGILYAYDLANGQTKWTYNLTDAYGEPVTGQNWWGWITLIADGKIYVGTCEHSAENPLPRGAPQVCVNASNGAEIWRVNGMFRNTRWGGNGIIGDSILATMDTYDQRVYAIGKGPTAMTVTAPDSNVEVGKSITIRGTVMDNSPGLQTSALQMRFPNGVAAVSDESQSAWMLYVYKQFEQPSATGVPVVISVVDANGNFRQIGATTSDATGQFSFSWQPDIAGLYTVIATFDGSNAYYSSYAETSFSADEAAATPAPAATQEPSMADLYFLPISVALVILVVIVLAMLAIMIMKKP
ncbi:hypothetical protein GX563_01435 [Candidatus Bathyarchaeota archaeon]|nr:hypothetical protein [Candidatus Bathyarchaeota archaeon]